MKQVTITIKFNISEEDIKANQFQDFKNEILSGKMQREMNEDHTKIGAKNYKINLEIK